MLGYYDFLYAKYRLEVWQFVFYIGRRPMRMPSKIAHRNLCFDYTIIDFSTLPFSLFIESDNPREVVLGILSDLREVGSQETIRLILARILAMRPLEDERMQLFNQLEMLGELRNLQPEITQNIDLKYKFITINTKYGNLMPLLSQIRG